MVEVSQFVELEGQESCFHEVLLTDQVTQLLLLLNSHELGSLILSLLLSCAIAPHFEGAVCATRDHMYCCFEGDVLAVRLTLLVSLHLLNLLLHVESPDLVIMHLDSAHTLLLFYVPNFCDSVS